MRVLFVAGNRERLPDPVIPLGVLTVLAACPEHHERHFVDLCFEPEPVHALAARLREVRPHVVALGMRNVQDNEYGALDRSVAYYRSLVAVVRAHAPAARVVVGGGGFSVMPDELLVSLGADYGVAGEGEVAFARLLDALEGREALDRIGGVLRMDDGRAVCGAGPRDVVPLDAFPLPDRRLVDRRHYARCGTDSIQTKRGCPLRCTYCTYPDIEGRLHRLRAPARVAEEFEQAKDAGARHVFVVDAVFNLPPRHARAVCDAITERGLSIPWTSYVNPRAFEPDLAAAMRRAGAVGMEVGSDAGDDRTLARLRKGFGTRAIRRLHEVARGADLMDCHTFILGTPGESLEGVRRTLDFAVELDPAAAIFMVWNDEHEALDPPLAQARRGRRERILELLDRERAQHPRWIIPALGTNFRPRSFALLRRRGLSGPLWQHLPGLASAA